MTKLCRNAIEQLLRNSFAALRGRDAHAGLLLTKGLSEYPEDQTNGKKAGEVKASHIQALSELAVPDFYQAAFARWQNTTSDVKRFASCEAQLAGRLYIGITRDNAIETGVTVSHTYGMPMIPGSAVKGLCRACAGEWWDNDEASRYLFGNKAEESDEAKLEVGGLQFHDAWWIPEEGKKPFVPEVVTVHHPEYYVKEGKHAATDFDSPNPAAQIAVQGSFYFVVEGETAWTKLALRLLQKGLAQRGIGAKRSSGYGFFTEKE